MIREADAIRKAVARRVNLDSLYLCGPFDRHGEPASPDIHILALSREDEIRDLHFTAGAGGFQRRVEVSVVPAAMVRRSRREGVRTWLAFYTLDKISRAKPLSESPDLRGLREAIKGGIETRPSFYAKTMGKLRDSWNRVRRTRGPAESAISANLTVLLSCCLYSLLGLKQAFSRNSELVTQTRGARCPASLGKTQAQSVLSAASDFIATALMQTGFDVKVLAHGQLPFLPEEES